MSIRQSSLICAVAYLQVYERVADNRWWPNTAVCKLVVIVNGSCLIVWLAQLI